MGAVVGLDAYTPAPVGLEVPEWVARAGDLWAHVDGTCRPVDVADAAAARLDITTCEEPPLACGVTVTARETLSPTAAWCERGPDEAAGATPPDTYAPVAADDVHVRYAEVVALMAFPRFVESETQRCTHKSLRALRATANGPGDVPSKRTCTVALSDWHVIAIEPSGPDFDAKLGMKLTIAAGRVDCREPCPLSWEEEMREASAELLGRWFLAPDEHGFELYRTGQACRASTSASSAGLPTDLCATLGAKLP